MRRFTLLALSLVCLVSVPVGAQPSLVRDVNPAQGDFSSAPVFGNFTSLGPRAVFVLSRPLEELSRSIELWTTDGTDAGTERLLALPDDSGVRVFASNGRLAFLAVSHSQVIEREPSIWRTDGTEAGTFPLVSGIVAAQQPAVFVGGSVVFSGCTPVVFHCEPWASDGTPAGTRRLRDITPGEFGSNPREFVLAGGLAYFFANAPNGTGLWRTDATRQGTRRVALLPTFSHPRGLIAAGNPVATGARLFFMMGPDFLPGGGPRASLWTSDGTQAGTRAVPPFDRARGRGPAVVQWLGTLGRALIFLGFDPAVGTQVYRTDGTPSGTRQLTDDFSEEPFLISGGTATLGNRLVFRGPGLRLWTTAGTRASTRALAPLALNTEFTQPVFFVTQGRAVFAGSTLGEEKDVEPWVTDGTPAGTLKLADICPGECSTFLSFGATLLGQVQFYSNGNLWGTDGTPEGTRLLARGAIHPPDGVAVPAPIASARRRLVFAGFDPDAPPGEFFPELKVTSGTPESTRTLDLPLLNGASSNPQGFTLLGDDVLFFACSDLGSVWRTDGTPETTVPLATTGFACANERVNPIVLDGIAYFRAIAPGEFWREVWRSDGTPAGTYPITNVGPAMDVTALTALNGELFFFTDVVNGDPFTAVSTLWRSDGTPTGTAEVFEFNRRYYSSLTTVGDRMFFVAWLPPDEPMMLYVSDGTEAGTRALTNSREVTDFVQLGGQIFYLSENSIWKTDGTPEGTRPFATPGLRVEVLADLAVYGGRLYFMGIDIFDLERNEGIPTLFRSDGTTAGTVRLKTFDKDDPNVFPQVPLPRFAEGAGLLFFVAHDKAHGSELWRTDGTAAGTVLVRDVRPGPASSRIGTTAGVGDRVFFSADDGEHGVELWMSNGDASGTRLVADVAEGPRSSFPREITRIGNRVFFSADDGIVGREPWVLPLDSTLLGRIIP